MSNPFGDAELKFPVTWQYRMIVEAEAVTSATAQVEAWLQAHKQESQVTAGQDSKGGKYQTLIFKVVCENRDELTTSGNELRAIPGVKILL